jgi:hypothetical protein
MGHILFVIHVSGGTLTYFKMYYISKSELGLFYSSLILNGGAVDAVGNCIRRGSSIVTAQRRFRQYFRSVKHRHGR